MFINRLTLLTASQLLHAKKYQVTTAAEEVIHAKQTYLNRTLLAILDGNIEALPEAESPFE